MIRRVTAVRVGGSGVPGTLSMMAAARPAAARRGGGAGAAWPAPRRDGGRECREIADGSGVPRR